MALSSTNACMYVCAFWYHMRCCLQKVKLWSMSTYQLVQTYDCFTSAVVGLVSDETRLIAGSCDDNAVHVLDFSVPLEDILQSAASL